MELAVFSLAWILWCAIHSILISNSVTGFFQNRLHSHFRFYRLSYNIFAFITIVPLCLWQPTDPFFRWEGYDFAGQVSIFIVGGFLMIAGALEYDMLSLAGIRQIITSTKQKPSTGEVELNYNGILGIIRHPWYLAAFILLWTSHLGVAEIIRNGILDCYLIIGVYLEERKLVLEFGEKYREYQQRVPMLIPYKILRPEK